MSELERSDPTELSHVFLKVPTIVAAMGRRVAAVRRAKPEALERSDGWHSQPRGHIRALTPADFRQLPAYFFRHFIIIPMSVFRVW